MTSSSRIVLNHLSASTLAITTPPWGVLRTETTGVRNLRRVTTLHVFSSMSISHFAPVRTGGIRSAVGKLFSGCRGPGDMETMVNLRSFFEEMVYDVVMVMVSGKQWRERCSSPHGMFGLMNLTSVCDYFPVLRLVGFGGIERKIMETHRVRDRFLQGLIDEARRNNNGGISSSSSSSSSDDQRRKSTLIETLLSLQNDDDGDDPECFTDDIIKGLIMLMFSAGADTTIVTLEWAMSLLLNHPQKLQKARSEIDEVVPPGRFLEDSDVPKLPYLRCVINETLRLFPISPLLVPHYSSEDCKIGGYDIPRGTTLLVNAWAIQRDSVAWKDPTKFVPERFQGVDHDRVTAEGFKFFPFGVGRRACPGSNMAMRFVGLALGLLIHGFDWGRVGSGLVDLDEGNGVIITKVNPLEALYTPRPSMINVLSQLL